MLVRLLAIAVCGAAGFFAGSAFVVPSKSSAPVRQPEWPATLAGLNVPTAAESEFIADWERLRAAHGADDGALYAACQSLDDRVRRCAFRSALIAEWSVRDPRAALAYILAKDPGRSEQLAREWMRRDPQDAIAGLLAGGPKARGELRALLDEVAKVAPSRLVEVITALKLSDDSRDTSVQRAFAILAAKDIAAAQAAAESLTGAARARAFAGVTQAWGEKDGAAALAWAQGIPAGEERDEALRAALVGWAKNDPLAALDRLDLAPPGGDRYRYGSDTGSQVLRVAAKKDWDGTIAWLRDHPGKVGPNSLAGLQDEMMHRLRVDTSGMMRTLLTNDLPGLDQVFRNIANNSQLEQHDAMWAWLEGQPPGAVRNILRESVLQAISLNEPGKALGILEKIPDTAENDRLLNAGFRSLSHRANSMDAFEGLLSAVSPNLRPRLIESAIFNTGDGIASNPARWIGLLNEIPAERRESATVNFVGVWAVGDPEAAARWASSLSESRMRDEAIVNIALTWLERDLEAAARWVDSLAPGVGRDSAAGSLVNTLLKSQPESAWKWAMTIQSFDGRIGALIQSYEALLKKNPAVAEETLSSAGLPEAEIATLRAYGKRPVEK